MKEFRNNDSLLIDHVASRVRDTVKNYVSRTDLVVEDSVLSNDPGFYVGEERVRDLSLAAEFRQHLLVVIGNGIQPNALSLEFGVCVAQLTELRPARRSPDCRTVKDDDRLMAVPIGMELNFISG